MALSQSEREQYLLTTKDAGLKKLNVRFAH